MLLHNWNDQWICFTYINELTSMFSSMDSAKIGPVGKVSLSASLKKYDESVKLLLHNSSAFKPKGVFDDQVHVLVV